MHIAPQFAAISLGQTVPLKGKQKQAVGSPAQQRDELIGVETIMKQWLTDQKDPLDKITKDRDIEVVIDANPAHSWRKDRQLIGVRFYEKESDGSKTKLEVRWPTLSGGPTIERAFEFWALEFLTPERKHVFNRLTKAVKMAIANKGTESMLYEDR
jgi:hypothetical protein